MWRKKTDLSQPGDGERMRLEDELSAMRRVPSSEFVRAVAADVRPRARRSFAPRMAAAGLATAALLVALAAMGGIGGAASRIADGTTAVAHVAVANSVAPHSAILATTPVVDEYTLILSILGAPRALYCAGPADVFPDGTPVAPGAALNLLLGQPALDPNYADATPAFYIPGIGLTCAPPAGASALANAPAVDSTGDPGNPGSIYPEWTAG
jgi:hypothetical protein